jgi:hypothetical protein
MMDSDTISTKKRILIIYTGGTMGMTHNESGALAPTPGCVFHVSLCFLQYIYIVNHFCRADS